MNTTDPIPIVVFGKDLRIATTVSEKLLPDFVTLKINTDLAAALAEFPPLFNPTSPSAKVPQAVFFGGGFTDKEYQDIVDAVNKAIASSPASSGSSGASAEKPASAPKSEKKVHFIRVQKRDVLAAGSFGPNTETICKVFRKKMEAALAKE
ncbi:hypothetical protein B0J18DRAFT_409030 [Chaetomium sp. MPI-SDFR-AT-0129]|nr:hypothetical protein B0J18DRAFT_409030 [Chaetomium sp. MPI-SDFR-AT-0129]